MSGSDQAAMVFVHGGQHTGACWQMTIDELKRLAPSVVTLAVDLPGRRNEPGDLATLTIDKCVRSVVAQIESIGAQRIMLVGHSQAGVTLPGVATMLGAERISRMVYIACCVPAQGRTVVSTLERPVNWFALLAAKFMKISKPIPGPIAKWMFANGMSKELKAKVVAELVPDSVAVVHEPVDRRAMPDLPTTWILTLRDHSLKPKSQRRFIEHLGNVDEVIEVDTCHNIMMSEPRKLAELLLERLDS
jgi:pimeloyl-ACP methyl ester carboxylesterase